MKILRYTMLNFGFAASVYLGAFEDVEGFRRLALFMAWFLICLTPFMLTDRMVKDLAEKKIDWKVPASLDAAVDVCFIITFVWIGWMATAIGYTCHTMASIWLREEVKKIQASKQENAE